MMSRDVQGLRPVSLVQLSSIVYSFSELQRGLQPILINLFYSHVVNSCCKTRPLPTEPQAGPLFPSVLPVVLKHVELM